MNSHPIIKPKSLVGSSKTLKLKYEIIFSSWALFCTVLHTRKIRSLDLYVNPVGPTEMLTSEKCKLFNFTRLPAILDRFYLNTPIHFIFFTTFSPSYSNSRLILF